jgi:DNA-binding PadR family transcriptional regulator
MSWTEAQKRYARSEKGKTSRMRYFLSEKGKAARAKYMAKRKARLEEIKKQKNLDVKPIVTEAKSKKKGGKIA